MLLQETLPRIMVILLIQSNIFKSWGRINEAVAIAVKLILGINCMASVPIEQKNGKLSCGIMSSTLL
jgi:hypothetical protein